MRGKVYRHKGYTFYATNCTTEVLRGDEHHRRVEIRPVFQIDDPEGFSFKEYGKRPFLTSIRECREYIDEYLEGFHRV